MTATLPERFEIAIIGAGFGGIGMGARLRQAGERNFLIFDKAAGVGGTWWVNRYPGCACDVPSHLYSFSFAPNPDWTRRFAPRAEIQSYLERCVERFGLAEHLRLNTEIRRMTWDEGENHWKLETAQGRQFTARVVISATGGLSRPLWPELPGLDDFRGRIFHSQQWDSTVELSGQRVAVIGTGASAAQFVPEIAPQARRLDVYQRTPNWILPRPDRAIAPGRRRLYRRTPWLQKLARLGFWTVSEMRVPAFIWNRHLAAGHKWLARTHLRRQVRDPRLRERLRPDYDMGCKRVILSSDFYPALVRTGTELVTDPIRRIEPGAIVTGDGARRPADVIILATGFKATRPVPEGLVAGLGGRDLAALWEQGPEAWRGVAVAGFPNLFLLMGPNTALGHNSVLLMLEDQIGFVLQALEYLRKTDRKYLEVRPEAQSAYNHRLHQRLRCTVWNDGGCRSWYLHPESGRNSTLWPGFTLGYRRMMKRFDPDAFEPEPGSQSSTGG